MELNESWLIFYGAKLGMSRREVMATRWGEMMDLVACMAIWNGAKPKRKKKVLSFEDIFLRG